LAAAIADGLVYNLMNFWIGLTIGLIVGANIGVVVAGMLASAKREEQHSMDKMEIRHTDESAVMEEDPECTGSRRGRARGSKSNHSGPWGTP
jgi:hypothetical protein